VLRAPLLRLQDVATIDHTRSHVGLGASAADLATVRMVPRRSGDRL
jgi:hypothetical protein